MSVEVFPMRPTCARRTSQGLAQPQLGQDEEVNEFSTTRIEAGFGMTIVLIERDVLLLQKLSYFVLAPPMMPLLHAVVTAFEPGPELLRGRRMTELARRVPIYSEWRASDAVKSNGARWETTYLEVGFEELNPFVVKLAPPG